MVSPSGMSPVEQRLAVIWQRALGAIDVADITPDADFFSLGATSLDVSTAVSLIRKEFRIPFLVQKLYEAPVLRHLGCEITKEINGSPDEETHHDLKRQWLQDAEMTEQLDISNDAPPIDWTAADEGRVFITGVTGFVGAFLLKALVGLPVVKTIKCLVRANNPDQGKERILDTMSKYNLLRGLPEEHASKIVPLVGDLSHPTLGLTDHAYAELATWSSVIYHLAALVNYNQPYSSHRPANVLGTHHILALATTCRTKPVHYTSSVALFGPSGLLGKTLIHEDEDIDPFIASVLHETGYAQSQWVAEKMLQKAMQRGLPATISRLGFVLCHSVTGMGNKDDFAGRVVQDALNYGIYPHLPSQRKEFLPVDYAVSSLLTVSMSPLNLGRVYHVTPDAHRHRHRHLQKIDMNDLFETIGTLTGRRLACLPYGSWVAKMKEMSQKVETRLDPLMPVLEEVVLNGKTRWELYENMARFDNRNLRGAFQQAGRSALWERSTISEESLLLYLAYLGYSVGSSTAVKHEDDAAASFAMAKREAIGACMQLQSTV